MKTNAIQIWVTFKNGIQSMLRHKQLKSEMCIPKRSKGAALKVGETFC